MKVLIIVLFIALVGINLTAAKKPNRPNPQPPKHENQSCNQHFHFSRTSQTCASGQTTNPTSHPCTVCYCRPANVLNCWTAKVCESSTGQTGTTSTTISSFEPTTTATLPNAPTAPGV